MTGATIEFRFDGAAEEVRFLEAYLADAWDRFAASDHWDHGWFWRYGQFADYEAGPDGGLVRLVFDGDPDALVAAERDRWAAFDGLDDWTVRRYDEPVEDGDGVDGDGATDGNGGTDAGDDRETFESLLAQQRAAKGAVGGEREYRFKALTADLALAYHESFDEPLPAAPEPDEADDPLGLGVWALCHDLLVQLGYDWYDETAVARRMLESRVQSIAGYRGADAAREEYERIADAWDEYGDELETWLAENPIGELSEP